MTSQFSRILIRLGALLVLVIAAIITLTWYLGSEDLAPLPSAEASDSLKESTARLNAAFETSWKALELESAPQALDHTIARRLSLALTGAAPSLEELRRFEKLAEGGDPTQSWLNHLFADQRYTNYVAERFARAFVGVGPGPFIIYRRRRMVNWLSEQLAMNRPYDELVSDLIASEGTWTTNPETNFITVSVIQDGDNKGPDEVKLAARTSRAFLGISLDCVQCHDDKFGDRWKQEDFHELAAFYGQADMTISGVREKSEKNYETAYKGKKDPSVVEPGVPFSEELKPEDGSRRKQLAEWITNGNNRAFARATVNRAWALLFGRPLVDPVDDIPLEGPYPAGFETLTDEFVKSGHDFRYLLRLIAASAPFQRASDSGNPDKPVTVEQEAAWAAFPVTPLRPEQVAGSIIQSASFRALDGDAHIIDKLRRFGETNDFVKRYGDQGENEFQEESGTIPQRLLLMNGKLVGERTGENPVMNSSTRVAHYSSSEKQAVDAAFLALLTRLPTPEESDHFAASLEKKNPKAKARASADLYWALINSTEFSWNR
ncbi:MAG: DUF1549 domain-containing protein [Verrucomicrobiales bacterium]|nr:DUF1549 domain-containing protein [Verrucomicrobiales bacterium]